MKDKLKRLKVELRLTFGRKVIVIRFGWTSTTARTKRR